MQVIGPKDRAESADRSLFPSFVFFVNLYLLRAFVVNRNVGRTIGSVANASGSYGRSYAHGTIGAFAVS